MIIYQACFSFYAFTRVHETFCVIIKLNVQINTINNLKKKKNRFVSYLPKCFYLIRKCIITKSH